MRWQLPVLVAVLCMMVIAAAAQDEITAPAGWSSVATMAGSTGLVRIPSADVVPLMKANGGWHRVQFEADDQDLWTLNVSPMENLEIGGARIINTRPKGMAEDGPLGKETVLNAKYRLDLGNWFKLTSDAPDVAVGVWDATDELNRTVYIVATRAFAITEGDGPLSSIRLHLGYGHTDHGTSAVDEMYAGRALDSIFGGFEFVPFRGALIQAEYDGIDYNAMLRAFPTSWLSLEGGAVNGEFAWGASVSSPL